MPSTTRGSILISTANDIGEALVEKLGGVGYSPNEWKEKYNLCGIAPVDSAPALSVLSDSAGTGDERGSILIATADAIGAILNKKYNVLRGFKPKEWASACRKMKALEEGSVASASIASFSDGADTVPLTSCVCNIDANLDGKSAVNAVHARKNLLPNKTYQRNANTLILGTDTLDDRLSLKAGTYTLSLTSDVAIGTLTYTIGGTSSGITFTSSGTRYYGSFTLSDDTDDIFLHVYKSGGITAENVSDFMLEVGSSVSTYEPYQTPETKTADLGRTIYGGSADIITGEGVDNCTNRNLVGEGFTWSYNTTELSFPYFTIGSNAPSKAANKNFVCGGYVNRGNYRSFLQDGEIGVFNNTTGINRFCIRDDSCTTLEQFLEKNANTKITYEVTNPTDFTFEPVKIDSFPGVNNIWNDCGNTAVGYYKAPTPYTRKTATGGIANFSDQRTDLPLTKAIANIAPSIAGKSAVNLYQGKKNLLKLSDGEYNIGNTGATVTISSGVLTVDGTTVNSGGRTTRLSDYFVIKAGTYFLSPVIGTSPYVRSYLNKKSDNSIVGYSSGYSFTVTEETEVYFGVNLENGYTYDVTLTPQLEVGSSAHAFVPYQAPTTYAAELGETVYGGSVDFVSGEVVKNYGIYTVTSPSDIGRNDGQRYYIIQSKTGAKIPSENEASVISDKLPSGLPSGAYHNLVWLNSSGAIRWDTDTNYATIADMLDDFGGSITFVYPIATPTQSAIPGRVISPIEGVNNYWNDAGGDTEIQYFEDET